MEAGMDGWMSKVH